MRTTFGAIAAALTMNATLFAQITLSPIEAGHLTSDHKSNGGVSMLDIDGDGNADILVTAGYDVSKKPERQLSRLYWGDGTGRFTLDENSPLTAAITYGSGSTWGDFDNDGKLDAAISCQLGAGSVLARGLGDRRFEIIESTPVHTDKGNSFSSVWADADSDGSLDLLVCNNAFARPDVSFFYKGDGKGGFSRISGEVAERKSATGGAYFGDLDGDGHPDLFMPNNAGESAFYTNAGDWKFVPATISGLDLNPFPVSGSCWIDFNNDGQLDLSMACAQGGNALLFKNVGGKLEFVPLGDAALCSTNAGLLQWGDLENDGDVDCIVPNWGAGSFVYENKGGGAFKRIELPGFTDRVFYASSCALADYDNDGRLDLLLGQWPVRPGDGELTRLFHNDTRSSANWVKIKLRGTASNRAAIGARVFVRSSISGEPVSQMREVNAGSGFRSQSDLVQHFGLGDSREIPEIEVRWPSGKAQILKHQPANRLIEITEPA